MLSYCEKEMNFRGFFHNVLGFEALRFKHMFYSVVGVWLDLLNVTFGVKFKLCGAIGLLIV